MRLNLNLTKIPFVFWIKIYKKKWFCNFWTTRGANFREIQVFNYCISIGLPWRKNVVDQKSYQSLKDSNEAWNNYKFSIHIGKYL